MQRAQSNYGGVTRGSALWRAYCDMVITIKLEGSSKRGWIITKQRHYRLRQKLKVLFDRRIKPQLVRGNGNLKDLF